MALTPLRLALGIGIGVAFGFAIERAGLGHARKLAGQFYFTDLTVFKVMFSAIVTAMLGTFWLGRLGLVDLAGIAMPETYLWPQLTGGAIFGAGFALAGLCPGTSCVAAATGRGDGVAVVGGLFFGVLVTGFGFAPLQGFYDSSGDGAWRLPQLLHVPDGVAVCGVVLAALGGFVAAERLETAMRRQTATTPPTAVNSSARLRMWLTLAAVLLGAAAGLTHLSSDSTARASATSKPAVFKPAGGC